MDCEWCDKVFNADHSSFNDLAIEIFHFQYQNNPVYKSFVDALQVNIKTIETIVQIPFLPIRFFKSHSVKTTLFIPQITFRSSGTTQTTPALHYIKDLELYEKSIIKTFEMFYGSITNWCIMGLLPSYLDRKYSSLVYMTDQFINLSAQPHSGFYLTEYDRLYRVLKELENKDQKTFLIGVTFALLDFAENYNMDLNSTTIVETGGMKGRQRPGVSGEITRPEVHALLKKAFGNIEIHSEYGMTELLSQAYSKQGGIFNCPPWMKVLIRDGEDPLMVQSSQDIRTGEHSSGAINIIDLANIYSCSFIATDDVGRLYSDGSFEVLGRMDESDLRGCSLMVV